jgi:deazaflavin-dependent oxidoreductase (nitroreductase family)
VGFLDPFVDRECCDVVTIGRKSGKERTTELWFGVVGEEVAFISGTPRCDWRANMLANPAVTVSFGEVSRSGRARLVTEPVERRRIGDVMGAKYDWSGDEDIGLTRDAWVYECPAFAVSFDDE